MRKSLLNTLRQVIFSSSQKIDFKNIGYLPRWIILCLDIIILFIALEATKLFVFKILNQQTFTLIPTKTELVLVVINVIFFVLLRTYAGLIRHSSFLDVIRFFVSSIFTVTTVLALQYLVYFLYETNFISIPQLLIYAIISFSGLCLFRIIVKQFFELYLNIGFGENKIDALIYGTNENAIAVANALKTEFPNRYKIKGFIEKGLKNKSKQILGLPIISLKRNIALTLRIHDAQAVILADNTISKNESLSIVDKCLDYNFKVFRVPIVSDIESNSNVSHQIRKIKIEDVLERDTIQLDNKLVAKEIFNKCILVTGGAGSIGSEIVRQVAIYKPQKLIILDQAESPLHQIKLEVKNKSPNLKFDAVVCDVKDINKTEDIFKANRPNVVFHAAAYKHVPLMEQFPSEAILTNVLGSKNVADLAYKYKTEKFVMVSTDKAVNPSSIMGASKRIAEIYVQSLHEEVNSKYNKLTSYVTTRFGNVLGSNGSVVPLFKRQIEAGGPVTITHPDIIRYFMTISEACQLVIEAGAMGNGGEVFIFDMGKAVKIIDLAKRIIRLSGFTPYQDIDIKVVGLRPGEKLYEELLNDKSSTLPTYNDKIMIAKVETYDYAIISKEIEELIVLANQRNNIHLVQKMKQIVPEFKSMNSEYEQYDLGNQVFKTVKKLDA